MTQQTRLLGALATLLFSTLGCVSPWEANFVANDAWEGARFSPTQRVELRTIPFERYQHYVDAERRRQIQSSTAPQDMDRAERTAAKNRLLETLQLRERGDELYVLGWSDFTTDTRLDPRDPMLAQFAKKTGADYVVLTWVHAGQVTQIENRPVTTYSSGFTTYTRGRSGNRRHGSGVWYSDQSTTWIPVQVTRDQYFFNAVFLRKPRPGDPEPD